MIVAAGGKEVSSLEGRGRHLSADRAKCFMLEESLGSDSRAHVRNITPLPLTDQ